MDNMTQCRVSYFPDYDMLYIDMKTEQENREYSLQNPKPPMGSCKHMHDSARFDCKANYTDPSGFEVDYPCRSFGLKLPFAKTEQFPDQKVSWYLTRDGYTKLEELFARDEHSVSSEELKALLPDILAID